MPKPFSYSRRFKIPEEGQPILLDKISKAIDALDPGDADDSGKNIVFKGGIRGGLGWKGWHPLNVVSAAKVEKIENGPDHFVVYELSFLGFFFGTILINLLVPFIQSDIELMIYTSLTIWIGFFIGNCALTIVRLNYKIRRIIVDHEREVGETSVSDEQAQWMADHTKCPACGFEINGDTVTCPDCGLTIKVE